MHMECREKGLLVYTDSKSKSIYIYIYNIIIGIFTIARERNRRKSS